MIEKIGDCETLGSSCSRGRFLLRFLCWVRMRQNHRICENDCMALILCPGNVSTAARYVRMAGMRSEFLVCLSGALQKLYCARSRLCLPMNNFDKPFINVVANTTRGHGILKHSAKADTKSFGRVPAIRTQTAPLSKLERTQIIKGAM